MRSRASPQRCGALHPAWLPLCRSTDGTGEPLAMHSGDRLSGTRPTGLRGLLSETLAGATPVLWGCRLLAPSAISKAPASCGEGLSSEPALQRRQEEPGGQARMVGSLLRGRQRADPSHRTGSGPPSGAQPGPQHRSGETDGRARSAPRMYSRARRQTLRWPRSHTSAWQASRRRSGTQGHEDEDASRGERFKTPKRTTAVSALP